MEKQYEVSITGKGSWEDIMQALRTMLGSMTQREPMWKEILQKDGTAWHTHQRIMGRIDEVKAE